MSDMNYLGNDLVYLEEERVNQWPDRRDRAVPRRYGKCGEKVCRPDRYVSHEEEDYYERRRHW